MTPVPLRSRKVRKILALEGRARRLLTRYERARDRATRAKTEVHRLLDRAQGIEWTLTGSQLAELHRGRAEPGPRPRAGDAAAAPPSSSTATSQ